MEEKKLGLLKAVLVLFATIVILLGLLAVYPFWLVFVKIANLIGVNGIRNINGKLQTPVVFYEHPVTKRIVAFVAAIHIGEPAYYAKIQKLIDSLTLKSYKILFEGIGKMSPQEEETLTPKEQEVAKQFRFVFDLIQKIAEVMSLQLQKEGLTYASSWVNTDMKLYDLIRSFARKNIDLVDLNKEKNIDRLSNESGQAIMRWLINKLFNRFVPLSIIFAITTFFSKNKRLAQKLILDDRNKIAVQGINEYLRDSNIVTIWGAAHLAGIEKQLKRAGFREIRREWFTAYTVKNYSLLNIPINFTKEAANAATTLKKD